MAQTLDNADGHNIAIRDRFALCIQPNVVAAVKVCRHRCDKDDRKRAGNAADCHNTQCTEQKRIGSGWPAMVH